MASRKAPGGLSAATSQRRERTEGEGTIRRGEDVCGKKAPRAKNPRNDQPWWHREGGESGLHGLGCQV